jgi:hypothetical protein
MVKGFLKRYFSVYEPVTQNGTGTAPDSQGFVGAQGWVREWAPGNFFGSYGNFVQLPGQALYFLASEK